MHSNEAKQKIKEILGYNIPFEGQFDKCFDNIKKTQQNELIEWVRKCRNYEINPIQSKKDRQIIGFIKRMGSNLRAILTKKKESYFIVLFLDKHKYYEFEMSKLGF